MDAKLLEILVCPVTKGPLVYDKRGAGADLENRRASRTRSVTAFPSCSKTKRVGSRPAEYDRGSDERVKE